ncbi:Ig-like domain-containing protein [Pseudomonas yamanorum]|uniref:Ig-like domain-containing protein n=1 Tax=Pseudomonas yamanorum TaxID=515393 RepID=UPI002ED2273D|nr:Ig-like domain-containing protein [Pseudomonas yamanorum]
MSKFFSMLIADKESKKVTAASSAEIYLHSETLVQLSIKRSEVKAISRKGGALWVDLVDGTVIKLNGFFSETDSKNIFVIKSESKLWLLNTPAGEREFNTFQEIDSIDTLLNSSFDLSSVAWVLGGLTLAGVALAAGGGGHGSDASTSNVSPPTTVPTGNAGTTQDSLSIISTLNQTNPHAISIDATQVYADQIAPAAPTLKIANNADGSLVISGQAEPGSTVSVKVPSGATLSVQADKDGAYSLTSAANQPSGDVAANAIDLAGNSSTETKQAYVDQTAPAAPTLGLVANADGSLVISGQAEPGSTVSVKTPSGATLSVQADKDGAYSLTSAANQPSGDVVASAKDLAGNSSTEAKQAYVDQIAPAAPTLKIANNADGSLVISGQAEPGSTVSVKAPSGATLSVQADKDGAYSLTSAANQPSGDVVANAIDLAGNSSTEAKQAYIDQTAPAAPTLELVANADGSLVISGQAEPGSTVSVKVPNGATLSGQADKDGAYSLTSAANQPSGDVVASAKDLAGNTGTKAKQAYIDQIAPAAPMLKIKINNDGSLVVSGQAEPGSTVSVKAPSGATLSVPANKDGAYSLTSEANQPSGDVVASAKDLAGNSSTEAKQAYFDQIAPAAPTLKIANNADGSLVVSGQAEPGSTVSVKAPSGATLSVPANKDGAYSLTSAANQPSGDVVASAKDLAGNSSTAAKQAYVDQIAPAAPTLKIANNADGSLVISGQAEPGSTVSVKVPSGATLSGQADKNGAYSLTSAVNQPSGEVVASAKDLAGNTGTKAKQAYIDQIAPAAPMLKIKINNDGSLVVSGQAEPGSTVSVKVPSGATLSGQADKDGAYSLTSAANQPSGDVVASAKDLAGNSSTAAKQAYVDQIAPAAPTLKIANNADGSLVVSGQTEPGSTVSVKVPGGATLSTIADKSGAYSLSTRPNQIEGTVFAHSKDVTGNESLATSGIYKWQSSANQLLNLFIDDNSRGGGAVGNVQSYTIDQAAKQITRGSIGWAAIKKTPDGETTNVTYQFLLTDAANKRIMFNAVTQSHYKELAQRISDVANISLTEVPANVTADIRLVIIDGKATGGSGLPSAGGLGTELPYQSTTTYTKNMYVHEMGHSIGLRHPGDYNSGGRSAYFAYLEDDLNYTVMSYNQKGSYGDNIGFSIGIMIDDIAAIQRLYGANNKTRSGDTTYGFNANTDDKQFIIAPGTKNLIQPFTIWDGGGRNKLDLSGFSQDQRIDLNSGTLSDAGGRSKSIGIAQGTLIQDVIVGSGNNTIIGNEADNNISCGNGNNTIFGAAGADRITTGTGNNTFVYKKATDSPLADILSNGENIANLNDGNISLDDLSKKIDTITNFKSHSDKLDLSFLQGDNTPALNLVNKFSGRSGEIALVPYENNSKTLLLAEFGEGLAGPNFGVIVNGQVDFVSDIVVRLQMLNALQQVG